MKFTHNNQTYELIVLHVAGSRLYGNSTEQSDWDYRGIFIAPKETKLGILNNVDQIEGIDVYKSLKAAGLPLVETDDIVIYELNRFVKLAMDNNPNIMDTLCFDYTNLEYTMYINDKGKELIDNKHLFISSKLKFTFSGYAISQLNKVRSREKYLTKYPRISEVLDYIKFRWLSNQPTTPQ
jgi:predicted nucleotidyltransferase